MTPKHITNLHCYFVYTLIFCKIHANNCNHIKKSETNKGKLQTANKFITMLQTIDGMKAITNEEMGTYCTTVGGSWKQ